MKKRVDWIDFTKGYLILSVVLLHCYGGYSGLDWIIKLITTFHMYMFFSISGYLTNFERKNNFLIFIKDKFKSLMIPYFVWGIIFGIPFELFRRFIQGENLELLKILKRSFFFSSPFSPTWFLFSLLLVFIIEYFIFKYIKNEKIVFVLNILLLVIGIILPISINDYYRIKTTLIACYYFELGALIKKFKIEKKKITLGIIIFVIGCYFSLTNSPISAAEGNTGNILYFLISTNLMILGSYIISSKIKNKIWLMNFLGENSIIILCIHPYVIYTIRILEKVLNYNIHSFPLILCILYVIALCSIFIKLFKNKLKFLFGVK